MVKLKIGDEIKVVLLGSEYSGRVGIVTYIDPEDDYIKLLFKDLTERIYFPRFNEVILIKTKGDGE